MAFRFRGVHSDTHFIVEKVIRSVLPPVSHTMQEIAGRPGAIHQKSRLGIKKFSFRIRIRQKTIRALNEKVREIADWLYSDQQEELVLDKDPTRYYWAYLEGDTDLDEIVRIGKGTLTFICPDPIAYDNVLNTQPVASGTEATTLNIGGTYKTYPYVIARVKEPVTVFAYGTENENEQVLLGKPVDEEVEVQVPLDTRVFTDRFTDIASWTTTATPVEYGEVMGTMKAVNVGSGYVTYDVFGERPSASKQWYGPAIKRSLPEPLTDWRIDWYCSFHSVEPKHMGRMELYLLDVNGVIIGKMHIGDRFNTVADTWVKIRIGTEENGHNFMFSHGDKPKTYNHFTGMFQFIKTGNSFYAYVGNIDPKTGRHHSRIAERWIDTTGKFSKALASVQLHIGAFGNSLIMPKEDIFTDTLSVFKRNVPKQNEVFNIAEPGDILEFDHDMKQVLKNGMPFKTYLNPVSNLFALHPGSTGFGFAPSTAADVEILYRNRWL